MPSNASARFAALLTESAARQDWAKLVLAKYHGPQVDLSRLIIRPVQLREQPHLSFV